MSFFGSRVVGLGLLIVGGRGVGLLAVASVAGFLWSASAAASTTTFSYTGGEQTYTVAGGVSSLSIVAIGAQGGAQTSCEAAVRPPGDQGRQQKPAPRVISCRIAPETLIPPPPPNETSRLPQGKSRLRSAGDQQEIAYLGRTNRSSSNITRIAFLSSRGCTGCATTDHPAR